MIGPQVLKTDAVETQGVQGHTDDEKNVIQVFDFPYRQVNQQVIQGNDEDHSVKRAIQKVFIQVVGNEPVEGLESDPDIGKVVRYYPEIIDGCGARRHLNYRYFKILVG